MTEREKTHMQHNKSSGIRTQVVGEVCISKGWIGDAMLKAEASGASKVESKKLVKEA